MSRRKTHRLVALTLTVFVSLVSSVACADKRVALVVGNSDYQHVPQLKNPLNDASDVRTKLNALGFQMFGGTDLDRTAMMSALTSFGRAAENADVALVFYAGHGLQVNGQNYLVPVDANVEFDAELDIALVPFSIVMQQLTRGSRVNIALLDACRDNPFAQSLSRSMGTRAVGALGRGLSRVHSATGTFIAYATEPDNVAQDGEGRNSPFTTALLKFIDRPGLSLSDLMIEVRNDVIQSTNGKQVPWDSSSLTGRFFFKIEGTATITPPPPQGLTGPQTPPPPDRAALELETWKAIRKSDDATVFKQFLERYPDGVFAQLARDRLAALTVKPELSATSPGSGVNDCDRLAASSSDPNRPAGMTGVESIAHPAGAVRSCQQAVSESPTAPRYKYQLGRAYDADKQPEEAVRLFRQLAETGYLPAVSALGYMYDHGHGVQQDYTEANRWYRKAADAGDGLAMANLGYNYEYRHGVSKDLTEALRWYRKSAEAGSALGMNNLGAAYEEGTGVRKDMTEAVRWYQKAAEAGNHTAMKNLGHAYEQGLGGLPRDSVEARRWYEKAAALGNEDALKNLKKMRH